MTPLTLSSGAAYAPAPQHSCCIDIPKALSLCYQSGKRIKIDGVDLPDCLEAMRAILRIPHDALGHVARHLEEIHGDAYHVLDTFDRKPHLSMLPESEIGIGRIDSR